MDFVCSAGHKGSMSYHNFYSGWRCVVCRSIRNSGPGASTWKGGIANEPYCDAWADKEYKEDIKERDLYRCQNPYCSGKTKRLCIHHIDYNKKNCGPSNLITVCNSCNTMANYDRAWHTDWYKIIVEKRNINVY